MTRPQRQPDRPVGARAAAVAALAAALEGRGFASQTLRTLRAGRALDARESALATTIAQGTIRHLLTIEHVCSAVARYEPRHTPAQLRAILSTAAYQVIWLEGIPPFAAVDEAVKLARALTNTRAAGMINAILRRLTEAVAERRAPWQRLNPAHLRTGWDTACAFAQPVLPAPDPADEDRAHLAAATGERPARYAALCARYGATRAEAAAWAMQAVPVIVAQRNTLRATPAEFEQDLRAACGADVEFSGDTAFISPAAWHLDQPGFAAGRLFVQDQTAHAAAAAVAPQPGERILDLCAAPGGKSSALALAMGDRGDVLACDVDAERLGRISENIARLGLRCIRPFRLSEADEHLGLAAETFDAALLDVPCSNSGVVARRPEARLGLTPRKLASLCQTQRALLQTAAGRVRPGGRLIYSTCSIEPAENEELVAGFLAESSAWRLESEQTTLPAWGPRLSDWCDGGYYARLRRAT